MQRKIYDFLLPVLGRNEYAVYGIMANIKIESSYNPKNLQNSYERKLSFTDESYTEAVDDGLYDNFIYDRAGYGLAQWTHWSRKKKLLQYAKDMGTSIGDGDMQLNFIEYELSTNFVGVYNLLKLAQSPSEAAKLFMIHYEKPKDQSVANQNYRAAIAEDICAQFNQAAGSPIKTHKVRRGDTLYSLAKKHGTTVQAIVEKNKALYPTITPSHIVVGWELII